MTDVAVLAKTKQSKRIPRTPRPDRREHLLDAAEKVVREEGYAAATVRRIAARAGVTHQAVFYYFGSQDELLLALLKRASAAHLSRVQAILQHDNPIRALWQITSDQDATRLGLEFMALANHNESIRQEIAANAEEIRAIEVAALEAFFAQRGIEATISPTMVSLLTNALARLLVQEAALGVAAGHTEAAALVEQSFQNFESEIEDLVGLQDVVDAITNGKPNTGNRR
jgi:TetR/AcrR family transcriptional regulator of autoinduction and epiphytic fitness